jgi:uncharacterized protein YfaS (alpha-2-macroglobulin family)
LAKFVPNLLTADVLRSLHIPTEKFNAQFESMMRAGKDRLIALQRPSGGWGWFDHDAEDPFMTACAVHGLSECDRLGFKVDAVVLKRGRDRLRALAQEEADPNRLAYASYALGESFERLIAQADTLSPYAQALLVLTLRKEQKPEAARLAQTLAARVKDDHWETPNWYYKWDNVSIETTAYAIQALLAVDPRHPLIPKATEWLLGRRQANHWRSTKDTAVAIATLLQATSLDSLAGAVGGEAGDPKREAILKKIGVTLDGGERREMLVDLNNPTRSVFEAHFSRVNPGPNLLEFQKLDEQSDFRFELELTRRIFDERIHSESHGMSVHVSYDRPLETLRLGDEVTATLTVSAASPVDYVLALSPIPAGCEVVRGSGTGPFARFEDRYEKAIFFLRSVDEKAVHLTYRMRCAFAGRFSVLPAWAGLMYNEEVFGTGEALPAVIAP